MEPATGKSRNRSLNHSPSNSTQTAKQSSSNSRKKPPTQQTASALQSPERVNANGAGSLTAAGFAHNNQNIQKLQRDQNYESDYSLNDTDLQNFPQQPSSGETMEYKYKKNQGGSQPPQSILNQPLISIKESVESNLLDPSFQGSREGPFGKLASSQAADQVRDRQSPASQKVKDSQLDINLGSPSPKQNPFIERALLKEVESVEAPLLIKRETNPVSDGSNQKTLTFRKDLQNDSRSNTMQGTSFNKKESQITEVKDQSARFPSNKGSHASRKGHSENEEMILLSDSRQRKALRQAMENTGAGLSLDVKSKENTKLSLDASYQQRDQEPEAIQMNQTIQSLTQPNGGPEPEELRVQEEPITIQQQSPDIDPSDLIALMQTLKGQKQIFRKKKTDMVLRQIKHMQDCFSVNEERKELQTVSGTVRLSKHEREPLRQSRMQLLKMIPTKILNRKHIEIGDQVNIDTLSLMNKRQVEKLRGNQTVKHSRPHREPEQSPKPQIEKEFETENFYERNLAATRLKGLIKKGLLDGADGESIVEASKRLKQRNRSIDDYKIRQHIEKGTVLRQVPKINQMTDFFPSRPEFYAEGHSLSFNNKFITISGNTQEQNTMTLGYDESSISFADLNGSFVKKSGGPRPSTLKKPQQQFGGSSTKNQLFEKRQSDSFQSRMALFSNKQKPKPLPPMDMVVVVPEVSSSEDTVDDNSLQNGSQEEIFETFDRIIPPERIDELEMMLERDIKYREKEKKALLDQPAPKNAPKVNRVDLGVAKSHTYHYSIQPLPMYQPEEKEEHRMFRDASKDQVMMTLFVGLVDGPLKQFQSFFIISRESEYIKINEELVKKIAPILNSFHTGGVIQKMADFNAAKIGLRKGPTRRDKSINIPLVVCDISLQELEGIEAGYLYHKKTYGCLSNPQIFDSKYFQEPESTKNRRLNENLPSVLIISIKQPENQDDIDKNTHIIMDFLRDFYLTDFHKYSRHLTLYQRPSSRYFNTHQNRELAMMTTGGFVREHLALPKWKVQNNFEMLNCQVAQLRRAYSLWLTRQSMNEDIKRTLFQNENDLLMNNIRVTDNPNLCSKALVEITIDKIIHLCLRPEDAYKMKLIFEGTKRAPERKSLDSSSVLSVIGQGADSTMVQVDEKENVQALYIHNHPVFIPYNHDIDRIGQSVASFKPQQFRMSILFGYKSKILKEGLYEVFEPVADARYILGRVFKRAFMRVRETKMSSQGTMNQHASKNNKDRSASSNNKREGAARR